MGTTLLLGLALGFLLLGPEKMYAIIKEVMRIKGELDKTRRGIQSQLKAELNVAEKPVAQAANESASAGTA